MIVDRHSDHHGMMQLVGYEVIDMVAALPGETEC